MDRLRETIEKNPELLSNIGNHPSLESNLIGVLRNIERIIPEDCRSQFYDNIELLIIAYGENTSCSLNAPVVYLDEKLKDTGLDINYVHSLENKCHVDVITHLVGDKDAKYKK